MLFKNLVKFEIFHEINFMIHQCVFELKTPEGFQLYELRSLEGYRFKTSHLTDWDILSVSHDPHHPKIPETSIWPNFHTG